jgi:chitodextrinase
VSAAAAKRTALAAASILALLTVLIVGPAEGRPGRSRDRVAPTAPADVHVVKATPSAVYVSWAPSQDDTAVAGYYVYGDSGKATVPNASYIVSGLACGESSALSVSAFDRSGNRSPRVTALVATAACLDTQPPSAPTGFKQLATTQSAVLLGWSPSTDNVGVVGYGVFRGTAKVSDVSEPTLALNGLTCDTSYSYLVDAVDAAGNHSQLGTAYVRTAGCADTTPPSTPSNLTATAQTQTSISVAWSAASDNTGVAGYRVSVGGTPTMSVPETSATVTGLACGKSYALAVDAYDGAGNRSSASSLATGTATCTTSSPPPSPPPPAPTPDTNAPTVPGALSVASVTQTAMNLQWAASTDDVGVVAYDVYRNTSKVGSVTTTSSSQSSLTCGTTYQYDVVARDAAGNVSQPARASAATSACSTTPPPPPPSPAPPADTTPPSQPTGLAVSGSTRTSISLTWGASTDDVGVTGYRTLVNGSAVSTSAQLASTVSGLSCGTGYTLEVEAYDAAGNRSGRASVVASTVACPDTQAPSQPSNVVATSRTATSIALGWNASTDNVGVAGYDLYRGGAAAGTSSTSSAIFSGLACNTNYTLAVDSYDAAGNRSAQTVVMVSTTACPDTSAPTAPTGLAASNVSQTGLTLTWNASSDNTGVTGYDVYRNGTKMTTTTSTSASQSGLACNTSYTFGVVARDAASNVSSQATLSVQTAACAAPPPPPPPPPPTTPSVTAHFISDWSTGKIGYKPWATIFQPGTPSYVDVGLYGSPALASAPSNRVAVVPNPYGGGNVLKCEIRNSDPSTGSTDYQKAELGSVEDVTWNGQWSNGQEIWISMELYLPDSFGLASGGFTNLMDMHPNSGSGVPGLGLGGYSATNIQLYAGVPGSLQRKDFIPLTSANRNRKLNVLIGAKIGTSGWVEAWLDGVNVIPRFNAVTAEASESGPYFKQGLYKMTADSFPNGGSTIYFGHTYIGNTKASVGA